MRSIYITVCLFFLFNFLTAQNLIINGDFELGPGGGCDCADGFICNNDAGRVVDGIHPIYSTGNNGCQSGITNYANSLGAHSGTGYIYYYAGLDEILISPNINFPITTQLDICVWYAGPQGQGPSGQNSSNCNFSLTVDGSPVGSSVLVPTGTPWTQHCVTVTVQAGNHNFGILSGGAAQYSLWFDDLSAFDLSASSKSCIIINEIQMQPCPETVVPTLLVQERREYIEIFNTSCTDTIDISGYYIGTDTVNMNSVLPELSYNEIVSWDSRHLTAPLDSVIGPLLTGDTKIPPRTLALILEPTWNDSITVQANQLKVDIPDNTIVLTVASYDNFGGNGNTYNSMQPGSSNGLLYNTADVVVLYDGDPLNSSTKTIDSVYWNNNVGCNYSLQRDNDCSLRWFIDSYTGSSTVGGYDIDMDSSINYAFSPGIKNFNESSSIEISADSICAGDSIKFIYHGPQPCDSFVYVWDFDDGQNSSVFSGPSYAPAHIFNTSGNYDISVSLLNADTNSCTYSCFNSNTTITVLSTVVEAGQDQMICRGDTVQLSASGAGVYAWTPASFLSDSGISSPLAFPDSNIMFQVTSTDTGLCANTDSVFVVVFDSIPLVIGNDTTICLGDSIKLYAQGGIQYVWTPSGSVSDPNIADPIAFPQHSTNYTVTAGLGGCPDKIATLNIIVSELEISTVPDTLICYGDSINLQLNFISAGISGYNALWSPGSSLSSNTSLSPIAFPDISQSYYVTITDGAFCSDTASLFIDVNDKLFVDAGQDTNICLGQSVMLNADTTMGSGTSPLIFNWSPSAYLNNTLINDPIASPIADMSFIVSITDHNNCFDIDTIKVFVDPLPFVNAGSDVELCSGDSTEIGSSNENGFTYLWTPSIWLGDPNDADPLILPDSDEDTTITYILLVVDTNGCSDTDTILANIFPWCQVNAGPDVVLPEGESTELNAAGSGIFSWYPTTGLDDPNASITLAAPTQTTTYIITLTDNNQCICNDSVILSIVNSIVSMPTGFTPNGDNNNDLIEPRALVILDDINLKIFNRWGKLVFESNSLNDPWNGTYNGEPQQVGTYIYLIEYTYKGTPSALKGNFSLIR